MENVWDGHDCPMCGSDDACSCDWRTEIEKLREIKYLTAALLDSFQYEPATTPWAACVPRELLEKLKKLTSPRGEKDERGNFKADPAE